MLSTDLLAAFFVGIAGSVHCAGMCGGIIAGLNYAIPKGASLLPYALAYNIGRILCYAAAGALAGSLGAIFSHQIDGGIIVLKLISGIFLILLAAYIGNWWRGLAHLENVGKQFWKRIVPFSKKLVPFKSPFYALPYGIIWGWLPCGLVYSTLTWSLSSGDSLSGGLWMLFFGLGTLPSTLLIAFASKDIQNIVKSQKVRQFIALTLLLFGFYSISQSVALILW